MVSYERGCNVCDEQPKGYPNFPCQVKDSDADRSNFTRAAAAAKAADIAVLFLGNDQTTEAEAHPERFYNFVGFGKWSS